MLFLFLLIMAGLCIWGFLSSIRRMSQSTGVISGVFWFVMIFAMLALAIMFLLLAFGISVLGFFAGLLLL